jgi:dGTPase
MSKIDLMFELLFKKYLCDLETGNEDIDIFRGFLNGMSPEYKEKTSFPEIVRDFMAGMTDEYFLNQCQIHLVPQRKTSIA